MDRVAELTEALERSEARVQDWHGIADEYRERNEKLTEALNELIAATANVSAQFPARDRARAALTLEEGS